VSEEKSKEESSPVGLIALIVVIVACAFGLPFGIEMWTHRAHSPNELAKFDVSKSEDLRLDPKGMTGTFEKLDVVENAKFALSLAKIWDSDAELVRIRVGECERGGIVDVADEDASNDVRYDFVALGGARRSHTSEKRSGVELANGSAADAQYQSLRLVFKKGHLVAKSGSESPVKGAPPTLACPMSKLGDLIATSNMHKYAIDLRSRSVKVGKDASGSSVYKDVWRWEASGDGPSTNVCDDTCTLEGTPECPAR
jgi:hypothetical protein